MHSNIHVHFFSADHTPSVQLYYLLRGALHGAARALLPKVIGRELNTDDLKTLDRSMDRFAWPWPILFDVVIAGSSLMSLLDVGRFVKMLETVSRMTGDEARAALGVDEEQRQADFLRGLIRRKEDRQAAGSAWPFRDGLCDLVSELYAAHRARADVEGTVTHRQLWDRFIATPGADSYQHVVALSINFDEAFLDDDLPGLEGEPRVDFAGQVAELAQLSAEVNAAGAVQIVPFFGVDPRGHSAATLLNLVTDNVGPARPFRGLKIYPPMGVLPTDDRLHGVFDFCQDQGLPVLSHCSIGGGGVRGSDRNYADLAHPYKWEDVLGRLARRHQRQRAAGTFRLCLAHFDRLEAPDNASWSDELIDLMQRFDGSDGVEVYSDIAFDVITGGSRHTYQRNVRRVQEAGLADRVLYGSDWWNYLFECDDEAAFMRQLELDGGWWKTSDLDAASRRFLKDVL